MPNPEAFISLGGELAELAAAEAKQVAERLLGSSTSTTVKAATDMPAAARGVPEMYLDAEITADGGFRSVMPFHGLTAREAAMSDSDRLWEQVDRMLHFSRSKGVDGEYSPEFQKMMTAAARKGSAIDQV